MERRRLRLLSANIQAGSSTRGYHDYVARSWSHVLPAGNKRGALDSIAELAGRHDSVGLQEADPGSLRSGFTNQTHYLAERAGFAYWSHQPNRRMGGVASSANGLLSRLEPRLVEDHPLPGRVKGRGVLTASFGDGRDALTIAVAHLSLGRQSRRSQLDFIADLLAEDQPVPQPPMVTLQILGGRQETHHPGDVLGALTGEAGFSASKVGKINVNDQSTYVAVERGIARQALKRLADGKIKGKKVRVFLLDE